jgi:putative transposase
MHAIWDLPEGDAKFSVRWAFIKRRFTECWLNDGGVQGVVTAAECKQRRRGVWQPRFWEHMIRDQEDLFRHLDYIHFNPVKHGLAACPHQWAYSTFHQWVRRGDYEADWLCACEGKICRPPAFSQLALNHME